VPHFDAKAEANASFEQFFERRKNTIPGAMSS